ncbi:methyltransferase family protein [Micromonospora sp. NPDC050397]|uniref:methyltransferase family protein n=1 Tax=Micromonospora sp. NPDC050397 TaxID=3364279 RepID=UPI00384CD576
MRAALRVFPLAALGVLVLATTIALVREASRWAAPDHRLAALFAAAYLGWLLLESGITVRSAREEVQVTDRWTAPLYGLARVAVVVTALYVPAARPDHTPWTTLLLPVFLVGVALRLWAIRKLGGFYSHKVRTVAGHRIVRSGPYRFVRHPAYAGMLLAHLALVLFFLSNASVAVLVVFFVPTLVVRILVEESLMLSVPGYASYATGRRRLVPYVW